MVFEFKRTNLYALTTFLNHLEKDLDVKLFDRSAVPMKLTPAGELYINKAKKMLCIKEEFDRELQVLKKRDLSCIRVGIQQIRAPHVVPPLTMAVKQEFPKLDVVFDENHGENFFDEGPVAVYHSKESFAKRIWN